MKLRPPAIPLITVDPYFSVWSFTDKLNESTTKHWTGSDNTVTGTVTVDGEEFRFMGKNDIPEIKQEYFDMSALVSDYVFANDKIVLNLSFYSSLFPNDLYRLSRPVSYLTAHYESADGEKHNVSIKLCVSEEICLDKKGDSPVDVEKKTTSKGLEIVKIGSSEQKMLTRCGDDLRIEWGYFYLCAPSGSKTESFNDDGMTFVCAETNLTESEDATVLFAYDDIKCLNYFGDEVDAYWKTKGISIEEAIDEAFFEQIEILEKCRDISEKVYDDGESAGGEKYADLLTLAYRQLICGHKIAVDKDGEVLFISKECFSNGCTATVDVTYPSAPFFILYNTELLKGMLRPIFKYAATDDWEYDFAPHDAGTYPLVTGQRYGWKQKDNPEEYFKRQMPVEECGNMLVLMANIAMVDGNTKFCNDKMDVLAGWVKYMIEYGEDPEDQLCTDDFAGHLAHNCNLSLKAIMGIVGFSKILEMQGKTDEAAKYLKTAKDMALSWTERAANDDGSFRLAFDRPDTFSMKYNVVWDKLWKTKLFAPSVIYSEFASNKKRINPYGMPLDNRKTYTKSDWLVWTATLAPCKEEFEEFITPMWNAYNTTPSRVPMTDWYDTVTSEVVGFRHRTVQGGLFIKLLENIF